MAFVQHQRDRHKYCMTLAAGVDSMVEQPGEFECWPSGRAIDSSSGMKQIGFVAFGAVAFGVAFVRAFHGGCYHLIVINELATVAVDVEVTWYHENPEATEDCLASVEESVVDNSIDYNLAALD